MPEIEYLNISEFVFKHVFIGLTWAAAIDVTFAVIGSTKLWVKFLGG